MKNKCILVPLDLLRGSPDALEFVQNLAMENPLCVTLLHVVDVNIAPILPGIYDELYAEAEAALRKLAKLFFEADQAARVVVRIGKVSEEIVAEAKAASADMIVLGGSKIPKRFRLVRGRITRHVLRSAPCPTVVLPNSRKVVPRVFGPQRTISPSGVDFSMAVTAPGALGF
jgi:nucleotide-binding universal stress UspA family protein